MINFRMLRFSILIQSIAIMGCVLITASACGMARKMAMNIKMVAIPAGTFSMGSTHGDFDERPVHTVTISDAFTMSATPITNAQYEQFDLSHKRLRGEDGFSKADNEAVVFVSYNDAVGFCEWMSKRTAETYRLPTEAEWEYACRAGTTTAFNTGKTLSKSEQMNQKPVWGFNPQLLFVGRHKPNAWGLYDVHGQVEQWCADWYGPYVAGPQTDPVGRASGEFRVTRGGSCNTPVFYLRSANRLGDLPSDRNWLIGFRIVRGKAPTTAPLPAPPPAIWAQNVSQKSAVYKSIKTKPYFAKPIPFVTIPPGSDGPLYSKHDHCPSIAVCPNGDLLATFYTCRNEDGRELAVAATRLRYGSHKWEPDSIFYKAPDRNMHATAIWTDPHGTLWHFQGLSVAQGWESLALLCRTSTDNGATWSKPQWIEPNHQLRNMPIATAIGLSDGHSILLPCDAVTGNQGGTAVHVSHDDGKTWFDPGRDTKPLRLLHYKPGLTSGTIAGIHAKVVQLHDGRLMAFGRQDSIDGHMPVSYSSNLGRTWTYAATPFLPIVSGQRLVLMRLNEGPLLLVSFANEPGMKFKDAHGHTFIGHGMFAALSFDDGKTWPTRKLLTPGIGTYNGWGWTGIFHTDSAHAEPKGYLAAAQSPDNIVNLLSSGLLYRFDLEWIETPNEPMGQ